MDSDGGNLAAPACIHAKLGRFWYNVICRRKYYSVMHVIIGAYLRMKNRKGNFIRVAKARRKEYGGIQVFYSLGYSCRLELLPPNA